MAINPHIVLYNGAGAGSWVEQAFQNNLWGCTSLYISAIPRDQWTAGNERLALPGLIAQYGKRVWFGGLDGGWGAAKIADLIDYWENKSGVGHLIDGYGVRDEYSLADQSAIGNDIELIHSLTSKPVWANIIPPTNPESAAQRMNFGTNINRYPNIFTFDDYPYSGDDSKPESTYLGSIWLCRSWARLMIDAYKNAPVYLSPANGHILGIISQSFQQVALTRSDKATVNAGHFLMTQAKITQQMDLAFAQGTWADLADQRDGKQIFGNSFTSWYVHYDTGQDKGTRINLSGGSDAAVRDNLRVWVVAANSAAKSGYSVPGSGVFQPGAATGSGGQVATPIIVPATGTYATGQNATITCATAGAVIYYTTNGSDPTTASAIYSAPIAVAATTTIKALAVKAGMTNSNIALSVLTFPAPQPGNITQLRFFPMVGLESRSNGGVFSVSNDFQNWTAIYTIPSTPAAGWNTVNVTTTQAWRYIRFQSSASQYAAMSEIEFYNGANKLGGGVIASAFSEGYPAAAAFDGATSKAWKSADMAGWVVMDLNAPVNTVPVLDPVEAAAMPGDEVTVYVRNSERASIYKIEGCPAFAEIGYVYSDHFNVNINGAGQGSLTVVLADGTRLTLAVRGLTATDVPAWRSIVRQPKPIRGYVPPAPAPSTQVETPSISPASGTYSAAQTATIVCATSGATIRYTTDGTEPTSSSSIYTAPLTISATTTLKARAFKSGMTDSATAIAIYTIAATPSPITQTIGAGSDAFVVKIAQDYYQGPAQYTIKVDGVQIGGTLTAGALKSSGQSDTITVLGNWGTGSHTLVVEFLNDAYGGTPQTDRNLYVTGITYNTAPMTPATASLPSTGTATFRYGSSNTALPIALWLYYEWESEALTATKDEVTPLGFNAVILDATAPNRAAIADIAQSKGLKVWWLLTRGGPDIEAIEAGDLTAYGNIVDTVKGKPATAGYYISDECDKTGSGGATGDALRKSNYAALVNVVKTHDPNHPTVNVSTGLWYSGSASSTERAYSRQFLSMGDGVTMFSLAPQVTSMTTIDAMFAELKTLFSGDIGAFLPVWIDNLVPSYPMASTQQMVDAAMAAKRGGAKYLACWGYKDFRVPIRYSTIGDNATIKQRWLAAVSQIRAQW